MKPMRRIATTAACVLVMAAGGLAQTPDVAPARGIDQLERTVEGGAASTREQLDLASLYIAAGRYYEASKLAERILAGDPGHTEAATILAQSREGLQTIQLARIAEAEARGQAAGASVEDRLALADAYFGGGRYISAAGVYASLPESARTPEVRLRHARALSWGGRMWDAERIYAVLLRESPTPELQLEYGRLLSWMGASGASREQLRSLYETDSTEESAIALANALAWSGGREDALALLNEHIARNPDAAEARELLASLSASPDLRLERIDRLIEVEPYNLALQVERARLLYDAGRYGRALRAIDEIEENRLDTHPIEGLAELRSQAQEARDREAEALRAQLSPLEGTEPPTAEATLELAKSFVGVGDHEEALRLYEIYLAEHPDDDDARIEYARILTWESRYPDAQRQYRILLASQPDRADLRLEYAKALSWDSNYRSAITELSDLTDLSDNPRAYLYDEVPAEAHFRLGQIYRWFGWQDHAAEHQNQALELNATYGPARRELDLVRGLRPATRVDGRYTFVENSSDFQANMFDLRGMHWTSRRTAIEGWLGHHQFEKDGRSVDANVIGAGGRYRFEDRWTGFARVGITDYSDGFGTRPFWTLGAEHLPSLQSRFAAEYARYDLLYDVFTLESLGAPISTGDPIYIDDFRTHWDYDTGGRLLYLADASYGAISDDNSRGALRGLLTFRVLSDPLFVALKADGRYLTYDFRSNRYWSPEEYSSLAGVLQIGDNYRERFFWQAELKYGKSWESDRASRDLRSIGASVTVPINERFDVIGSYVEGRSGDLPNVLPGDEFVTYWQRTWYVGLRVKRLFSDDDRTETSRYYYDERPLQSSPVIPPVGERR